MDQEPLPTSLQEVESLILQLYQSRPPQNVVKIQETLQRLQRSPDGWQLASSLLGSREEKVKFFGALTFTVKLNTDSKSLSEDDALALLENLIVCLNRCLDNGDGPLVVRKLCSTFVAYFLHFSSSWTRCIRHLIYCLCIGQTVPYETLGQAPETSALIQNLPSEKALVVLWFSAALVEEVGKTDSNSMKHHQFHQRMIPNVDDIALLIAKGLADNPEGAAVEVKIRQECMKCFQSWVLYSHRAFVDAHIVPAPLQVLTKPAMMCIVQDDLYEITVELFTDVLANYSRFLDDECFKLLYSLFSSPWAHERYERLIKGDFDFDSLQFGMFMIAFGDATVQDLAQNVETDTQARLFLTAMGGLLGAAGHAVSEDKIFVPALEFWSTFVETMIDYSYSAEGVNLPWFPAALSHVIQAIERCWRKIQFPVADVFSSWDSVDRTGFKDARKDVADLLQSSYTQAGPSLFSMFVNLVLQSIDSEAWAELEASLFCLTALSDCTSFDEVVCDDLLGKVWDSPLFALFTSPGTEFPSRTKQSFLSLIDGYSDYFERHTKYLPNALNILFKAIESPALAGTASRSIYSLCSRCRSLLTGELSAFLQQYRNFAYAPSLDSLVKERIMGAVASIIQAMPDEAAKLGRVDQLLYFVEVDIEQCLHLIDSGPFPESHLSKTDMIACDPATGNYHAALEFALSSLRSLGSIAKGLQAPHDVPVDLETKSPCLHFWTRGDGSVIQERIITMILRTQDAFPKEGDIIEVCSNIFRAGFTENEPGPFTFPPRTVARFLLKFDLHTPRLGIIISTACSLVSSHTAESSGRIDEIIYELVTWVAQLLQKLEEPANEPEIAQNGIDFINRLVPTYLNVLLNHQPPSLVEFLFMFAIKALTGRDPLPKFVAADFWSSFVALKNQAQQLQASVDSTLQHLGPLLAGAIIYNIGGNAARSELDKLSEPLKKLVVSQVSSKSWLQAALFADNFPSDKVLAGEKSVFLQKIINLRGARGTNQVVRDFWLACRGTNFAYAS